MDAAQKVASSRECGKKLGDSLETRAATGHEKTQLVKETIAFGAFLTNFYTISTHVVV